MADSYRYRFEILVTLLCMLLTGTAFAQPALVYSTYIGGDGSEIRPRMTTGPDGSIYMTGVTGSEDLFGDRVDLQIYVLKLNPQGQVDYVTILTEGGIPWGGIAVDADGNAYVAGSAIPDDVGADHVIAPGGLGEVSVDIFVMKLDPNGNRVFATLIHGNDDDEPHAIAVDADGFIYVGGSSQSDDLPTTAGAFQPGNPRTSISGLTGFIAKLQPDGSTLEYLTYLGGTNGANVTDLAVDETGGVLMYGTTGSEDFPTVNAYQPALAGGNDIFLARLTPDGSALSFSTYFGGSGIDDDPIYGGFTRGPGGRLYLTGRTRSEDFPTLNAVFDTPVEGRAEAVAAGFDADGRLLFSTYLGMGGAETGRDIAVDAGGAIYLTGITTDPFGIIPSVDALQDELLGFTDTYVMRLTPNAGAVTFASLLGGSERDDVTSIALVPGGRVVVAGETSSEDYPTTSDAVQSGPGDRTNAFVSVISLESAPPPDGLVVQVMSDSLAFAALPVRNTAFEIGRINHNNPQNPFIPLTSQVSDENGMLVLDPDQFAEGDAFYVRVFPHQEPAVKAGHEAVDGWMYEVEVDNLFIDLDGNVIPDTLEADFTTTFLGHPSIGLNLVISIEWPALSSYVESLQDAFRSASNFLLDVSNGQIYLNKIAIYDDMQHWEHADIQIYAANTQWPSAIAGGLRKSIGRMYFPPKHYGRSEDYNVNQLWVETILNTDVDLNIYDSFAPFVHELGHYAFGLFDEYQTHRGTRLPDTHFGVMDKTTRENDPITSEFSAFVTEAYEKTENFARHRTSAWGVVRDQFRALYGDVVVDLHTPMQLGLQEGERVSGPNDDLQQPNMDLGSQLEFVLNTSASPPLYTGFQIGDGIQPYKGLNVQIDDPSSGRTIQQGKTLTEDIDAEDYMMYGNAILRGVTEGKIIRATGTDGDTKWVHGETLISPGKTLDDPIEIPMTTLDADITLRSAIAFTENGQLEYGVRSSSSFSVSPRLDIMREDAGTETVTLDPFGPLAGADLPGPLVTDASLLYWMEDDQGQEFFVPQNLSVRDVEPGTLLRLPHDNAELFFDVEAENPDRIAVLSSQFPAPTTGLEPEQRRVSPVYTIDVFPSGANLAADLKIYYDADSLLAADTLAVSIYQWDSGWVPLETGVNITPEFESAIARITEPGQYAAFIDLNRTTAVAVEEAEELPTDFRLEQNYPNPFNPVTTIAFTIPDPTHVRLTVYDVQGREVRVLADGLQPTGTHQVRFDARNLPSGAYFYQLTANGRSQIRTMILLR